MSDRIRIPLTFECQPRDLQAPALEYTPSAYKEGKAPRKCLEGRTVLKPSFDLRTVRVFAQMPWISFALQTDERFRPAGVQSAASKILLHLGSSSDVSVTDPCGEQSEVGREFRIRIQEPQPTEVRKLAHVLCQKFSATSLWSDLRIAGFEVLVRFQLGASRNVSPEEEPVRRWQLIDLLRRHISASFHGGSSDGGLFFLSTTLGEPRETRIVDLGRAEPGPISDAVKRLGLRQYLASYFCSETYRWPPVDTLTEFGRKESGVIASINRDLANHSAPCQPNINGEVPFRLIFPENELGALFADHIDRLGGLYASGLPTLRKDHFSFLLPTFEFHARSEVVPKFPMRTSELEVFRLSGIHGLRDFLEAAYSVAYAQAARGELEKKPSRPKHLLVPYQTLNQKIDGAIETLSNSWRSSHASSNPSNRQGEKTGASIMGHMTTPKTFPLLRASRS